MTVRLAAALWVLLLVGVGVRVALSNPLSQTVVPIYRTAGQNWRAGADLYAYHPPHDAYRNPPGFAAAFAVLTHLPETSAALLWRAAGAAAFLLGLRAFARDVLPPLTPHQAGLLFAAAVPLALPSVNNGQVNVLLAGAVLLGAAAAARGRWWPAAGWLGLAAWLKVYPLAAGLLLCVLFPRLRWRLAGVLAAGVALPFLAGDPGYVLETYRGFLRYAAADDRTYSFLSQVPRDWTIVPRQWFGLVPPPPMAKLVSAAAGLLLAGLAWAAARRAGTAAALPAVVGLGLVWMTLFGPATEVPTYTLLAPAAAAAVARWRGWMAAAGWLAFGLSAAVIARGTFPTSEVLPLRTAMPVSAAVLLAGLVAEAVGLRRAAGVGPAVVIAGRVTVPASSAGSAAARGPSRPIAR